MSLKGKLWREPPLEKRLREDVSPSARKRTRITASPSNQTVQSAQLLSAESPGPDTADNHVNARLEQGKEAFNTAKKAFLGDLTNYVPLGALTLPVAQSGSTRISKNSWTEVPSGTNIDYWFDYSTAGVGERPALLSYMRYNQISCLKKLRIFAREHQTRRGFASLRIYILPDDVGRRFVGEQDETSLKYLRSFLRESMDKLDVSAEGWEGRSSIVDQYPPPSSRYNLFRKDGDSLFYIFNKLPSPSARPPFVSCPVSNNAILAVIDSDQLPGLNTQLYPYQKRTAATMVKREVEPAKALDPRFQPLKAPTGQVFFFDWRASSVLRDQRQYEEPRGGILGESMGLGKTLICLAVILATKGNWPEIPPEYSIYHHPVRPYVGSLTEMAAAAVSRYHIPWRAIFQELSRQGEDYQTCMRLLENSAPSYVIPPPESKHPRRASVTPKGRKIYLTTATLIVVPQNLVSHWKNEISKHVENDRLQILYLESQDDRPLSRNEQLLRYDIILMSRNRFLKEMARREDADVSSSAKKAGGGCTCTPGGDCHCIRNNNYRTPLEDIHFLRVIMDEGHEFSRSGNLSWALKDLSVDRKWIVSGTPASGLLGAELETAIQETTDNNFSRRSIEEVLEKRRRESALSQERKDLENLGILVTKFLQVQPWSDVKDKALWQKYIMPETNGRRKAGSLIHLLESLVVRHQIEDIQVDIQLPPLHNRVTYLQPSWHDKLSINLFILNLTANAVTSERTDQDYMFHPKNRKDLHHLVTNLRYSGFYWTGIPVNDIVKTLQVSCTYLEEHKDRHSSCSEADRAMLEKAISIGNTVIASASWKSLGILHEMGIFVEGFPEKARSGWSLVPSQHGDLSLIGATQLCKAQQYVDSHLYNTDLSIGLAVVGVSIKEQIMDHIQRQTYPNPNEQSTSKQQQRSKSLLNVTGIQKLTQGRTVSRAKAALGPQLPKKAAVLQQSSTISNTDNSTGFKPVIKSALKISREPIDLLPKDSPQAKSRIYGTTSAKLSYLLDKVIVLHENEKILIFYDGDHIAWYIAQALDLIGIRYLIYTKTLSLVRQTAYITTFNTTETFRVLLMNVYQAAHGLHIASASRVFFVNPVWQPNVEAQAIKRAHRIGQTKPVYVETLVLRDTLEDHMLRRRNGMTAQEHQKAERSLLDDLTMTDIIKQANFIPFREDEIHDVREQVAKLQHPQQLFARSGKGEGNVDDPDADLIFPEDIPMANRE